MCRLRDRIDELQRREDAAANASRIRQSALMWRKREAALQKLELKHEMRISDG